MKDEGLENYFKITYLAENIKILPSLMHRYNGSHYVRFTKFETTGGLSILLDQAM